MKTEIPKYFLFLFDPENSHKIEIFEEMLQVNLFVIYILLSKIQTQILGRWDKIFVSQMSKLR